MKTGMLESRYELSNSPFNGEAVDWKAELKQALRSAADLVAWGFISVREEAQYEALLRQYQFLLPRYYAQLIDKTNRQCPIRLQAIPDLSESRLVFGYSPDPLGDLKFRLAPRVTHRYQNRVLIHVTTTCSMYCRFCFRKTLLNEKAGDLLEGDARQAIEYVAHHPEVEEVILSGGDPLMLSDASLASWIGMLEGIPHLERIRLHTRVPVTFPIRVTESLCQVLKRATKINLVTVTHFNHPTEVTPQAASACRLLSGFGTVLNQSVLLAGVNDKAEVLSELSKSLFQIGVLPYYLHHPDSAEGTSHFHLSKKDGIEIWNQMRLTLPGYLVPRYVFDDGDLNFKRGVTEKN